MLGVWGQPGSPRAGQGRQTLPITSPGQPRRSERALRTQPQPRPSLAWLPLGCPGHGISQQGSKHTQHRCVVNNFCFLPGKNEQQWWDQKGSPFTGNAEGVTAR